MFCRKLYHTVFKIQYQFMFSDNFLTKDVEKYYSAASIKIYWKNFKKCLTFSILCYIISKSPEDIRRLKCGGIAQLARVLGSYPIGHQSRDFIPTFFIYIDMFKGRSSFLPRPYYFTKDRPLWRFLCHLCRRWAAENMTQICTSEAYQIQAW